MSKQSIIDVCKWIDQLKCLGITNFSNSTLKDINLDRAGFTRQAKNEGLLIAKGKNKNTTLTNWEISNARPRGISRYLMTDEQIAQTRQKNKEVKQ